MTLTRRLIFPRHAKSAWPRDIPDVRRPLAERGRRDAPAVGRWLRAHIATIDRVVCSPAVRAVQTWNLAAAQLPGTPPACLDERLYGASAAVLLAVTQELAPDELTAGGGGPQPRPEGFFCP